MKSVSALTRVAISFDGEPLSDRAEATLEEVRVQQRLSQPTVCELSFFVSLGSVTDLANVDVGASLELQVPDEGGQLFQGEITAVEHQYGAQQGHTIRLRAYDRLHRLRKRQPVRTHVQVTPADLARELCLDLELAIQAKDEGPLFPWLLQYRQSDLAFLVDLCRRSGLYLSVREDTLHLLTLAGLGESIPLKLGSDLLEARLELNAQPAWRSITARGWNVSRVEAHESRVDDAQTGRLVKAGTAPELRNEGTLPDRAFSDNQQAQAAAQGEMDARAAREVTLFGLAEGNRKLQPGSRVDVSGVDDRFAGIYVLASVEHRIDRRNGYVSEISSLLPSPEEQPNGAVVVWGTVTSVEDPEALGRVRVWLPSIGNVESEWMGVMAAGAGSSKGLVILPDIDDQVLVLFIGGNPSQSVVLGGLYGTNGPVDYGVEGSSVKRYALATAGGQTLRFDDAGQAIRLENKSGSFIDFSAERFMLHSSVPLLIEAPGSEITISGKNIDFRQA